MRRGALHAGELVDGGRLQEVRPARKSRPEYGSGFDAPRPILREGYGATLAVPIWAQFMLAAGFPKGPDRFPIPSGIVQVQLCPVTGQRAGAACMEVSPDGEVTGPYPEYFPADRVPPPCTLHAAVTAMDPQGAGAVPVHAP